MGQDQQPYTWQLALTNGTWPQVIIAPTGSGKTAAVTLGWATRRLQNPGTTPRRLVWCLPMRALVEQTANAVREWCAKLAIEIDKDGHLPRPEDVHVLMGGVDADRWLETPERPAILVGTQDMLLSRALMRGYASSRALWPMQFALLHEDTQWVFDEVQLMGAGRTTSAQLEAFRKSEVNRAQREGRAAGIPARSLWISATLNPSWLATVDHPEPPNATVVRVNPATASDRKLVRLSHATKRLMRSPAGPSSSKKADITKYLDNLAETILGAHHAGKMTLIIVNRVDRAQALRDAIKKRLTGQSQSAPTLALVHSRFRPCDRTQEMEKVIGTDDGNPYGRIVVATQAVEAGVDISAAVLFTELAPWSSLVQRFGRANRYAELPNGADVYWIDILQSAVDSSIPDSDARKLARPYEIADLCMARNRLRRLTDVAPARLPPVKDIKPPCRVIRRKDIDDLFDTDPDLTGFDVDVSPYVRDADDTDIHVFWRSLPAVDDSPPRPRQEELCPVSIEAAKKWIERLPNKGKNLLFSRDPQWQHRDERTGIQSRLDESPPGWTPLLDQLWPGIMILADFEAGGYCKSSGFTGKPEHRLKSAFHQTASNGTGLKNVVSVDLKSHETEGHNEDSLSGLGVAVSLADHLRHVAAETELLCSALDIEPGEQAAVVRAARWHDLGKAHDVFQDTMHRGLNGQFVAPDELLAKTHNKHVRHSRAYFRHELVSALAFLTQQRWSRDADLIAYLIAAHHGKVRLNLRALPRETAPSNSRSGARFARGVWEGDELPALDLEGNERWGGGSLTLSIMELGWDDVSFESWAERTHELLAQLGPFRLSLLETLLRVADWRASRKEQRRPE